MAKGSLHTALPARAALLLLAALGAATAGACYTTVETQETVCPDPTTLCLGQCVDFSSDARHCGGCGLACAGTDVCVEGACVDCPTGQTLCGSACADLEIDAQNCGACGSPCAEGEVCEGGACVFDACPGQTRCGGACVDVSSDPAHCGACDNACPATQGCVEGACVPGCFASCAGIGCTDLGHDPQNCGACGNACAFGSVCLDGACFPCPLATTPCQGACVDLQFDQFNCGACGRVCGLAQVCDLGACQGACVDDGGEDNDDAASATPLAWDQIDVGAGQGLLEHHASLCSGDEDWFLLPTAQINLSEAVLRIDVSVQGAEEAGCQCSCTRCDALLAPGPHHELTLQVLDPATLDVLGAATEDDGVIRLLVPGAGVMQDVLLRFGAPAEAEYPYRFRVEINQHGGEDECEC